ncbi:MAG: hypothetical protein QNJ33_07020 [Crocosphaera sp.]|nr:hypothetical protein [Crocosphaera sp.]
MPLIQVKTSVPQPESTVIESLLTTLSAKLAEHLASSARSPTLYFPKKRPQISVGRGWGANAIRPPAPHELPSEIMSHLRIFPD